MEAAGSGRRVMGEMEPRAALLDRATTAVAAAEGERSVRGESAPVRRRRMEPYEGAGRYSWSEEAVLGGEGDSYMAGESEEGGDTGCGSGSGGGMVGGGEEDMGEEVEGKEGDGMEEGVGRWKRMRRCRCEEKGRGKGERRRLAGKKRENDAQWK